MKSKLRMVLALCLLMAGCSGSKDAINQNTDSLSDPVATVTETSDPSLTPTLMPTPTSSEQKDDKQLAMDVYKAVMKNEKSFTYTEQGKELLLNDFFKEAYLEDGFSVTNFTVIDMDSDGIPEVILEVSRFQNPIDYLILHDNKELVNGFIIPYRGLEMLKTDGTFWASSGAADNECKKLVFTTDSYDSIILAYSQSGGDSIAYYIDGQTATEEAFQAFVEGQDKKEDVQWYEFNTSNIDSM